MSDEVTGSPAGSTNANAPAVTAWPPAPPPPPPMMPPPPPLVAPPPPQRFAFLKSGRDVFTDKSNEDFNWDDAKGVVRAALAEAISAKNVAFLLGAGCSSFKVSGEQLGIPTMAELAAEFIGNTKDGLDTSLVPAAHRKVLLDKIGVDIFEDQYVWNLERLMEVLHSFRFGLKLSVRDEDVSTLAVVQAVIDLIQAFVWKKCTEGRFAEPTAPLPALYEAFYRKLVFRDRGLPRPWIFTTNYDLFNERAMDRLGLPYANGFSGVVERRFNPATFRYALAEQLDLSNRKWTAVDGFVYLCKLHGSVSWTEDDHGLFPIREELTGKQPGKVMIYPTPAKQNASLASPYADLFREFQLRIVREQSVLITIGYAFGDEHLNNIIYQALTIPTFRLIMFFAPNAGGEIAKLRALGDPRIWIIGGEGENPGEKAHYFDTVINSFMPDRPSERIDDAVQKLVAAMSRQPGDDA